MDSTMMQSDRAGHIWEGKINNIRKSGLETWRGEWVVDAHRLQIRVIDRERKIIDIWEMQSEQHWIGTYSQKGDLYECGGSLANSDRTFTAELYLPEAPG